MSVFEYVLPDDTEDFDVLMQIADKAQLIWFTAVWCVPCKMLKPVLESISVEYEKSVEIWKVDIDNYPEIAAKFEVRSVPTLVRLVDGVETTRIVGAKPKALLIKELGL